MEFFPFDAFSCVISEFCYVGETPEQLKFPTFCRYTFRWPNKNGQTADIHDEELVNTFWLISEPLNCCSFLKFDSGWVNCPVTDRSIGGGVTQDKYVPCSTSDRKWDTPTRWERCSSCICARTPRGRASTSNMTTTTRWVATATSVSGLRSWEFLLKNVF